MWEPDLRGRAQRGRDSPRPRLWRRPRCLAVRPPDRADRLRLRTGHDRRDAQLARRNAAEAGAQNVEFLRGEIEAIPLPDASVDVVISNCVINLSGDKPQVLREAARVLRPGGRFAVSDVIADADMDADTRSDMQQWTGCIAGALTREEFERDLLAAGLMEVSVQATHRVHSHAASAIIRARKR